jgi:hypothetical protein
VYFKNKKRLQQGVFLKKTGCEMFIINTLHQKQHTHNGDHCRCFQRVLHEAAETARGGELHLQFERNDQPSLGLDLHALLTVPG